MPAIVCIVLAAQFTFDESHNAEFEFATKIKIRWQRSQATFATFARSQTKLAGRVRKFAEQVRTFAEHVSTTAGYVRASTGHVLTFHAATFERRFGTKNEKMHMTCMCKVS